MFRLKVFEAIAVVLLLMIVVLPVSAIYCDEDDCYDLLGFVARLPGSPPSAPIPKRFFVMSIFTVSIVISFCGAILLVMPYSLSFAFVSFMFFKGN